MPTILRSKWADPSMDIVGRLQDLVNLHNWLQQRVAAEQYVHASNEPSAPISPKYRQEHKGRVQRVFTAADSSKPPEKSKCACCDRPHPTRVP